MKFLKANRIAPDGTPRSVASDLGLCYLPISHKRNSRLKGDKVQRSQFLRYMLTKKSYKRFRDNQIHQLQMKSLTYLYLQIDI